MMQRQMLRRDCHFTSTLWISLGASRSTAPLIPKRMCKPVPIPLPPRHVQYGALLPVCAMHGRESMLLELGSVAVLMSWALLLILPQHSADILISHGSEPKVRGVLQGAAL